MCFCPFLRTNAQKVPCVHGSQLFFPLEPWKYPLGQGSQLFLPVKFWKYPLGHGWHSDGGLHSPNGHLAQVAWGGREEEGGERKEEGGEREEEGGEVTVG